jgi:hypothetical protein
MHAEKWKARLKHVQEATLCGTSFRKAGRMKTDFLEDRLSGFRKVPFLLVLHMLA